jgi:hypothetical protein
MGMRTYASFDQIEITIAEILLAEQKKVIDNQNIVAEYLTLIICSTLAKKSNWFS